MIRYLRTGALAGAVGGLVLAVFLLVVGESTIDDAIAREERLAADAGDAQADSAPFTRDEQKLGGALGSVLVGVAFGAVFGVVFAALRHQLPGVDDWQRSLWLSSAAWLSVHLVPALKYPPNPPSVGDPDTVGDRTLRYLLLVAFSVAALRLAWGVATTLRERGIARHLRLPTAAIAWFALIAIALSAMPTNPDAVSAPAQLVWHFRLKSLSGSLVSWTVIGAAFGSLLLLSAKRARSRSEVSALT